MSIGFTGTQRGMTDEQKAAFTKLLRGRQSEFHHGDCIGADTDAHKIAKAYGFFMVGHPPDNDSKRAFNDFDQLYPAKPYLERNKDIVNATKFLIATPGEFEEQLRSGTWSTIRYARQRVGKVIIILPDGNLQ